MNHFNRMFNLHGALTAAAIGLYGLMAVAVAAPVRLDASCKPRLVGMDQKLYDKASEGTLALRRFISIRRAFVSNDTSETVAWAAKINRERNQCIDAHTDVNMVERNR